MYFKIYENNLLGSVRVIYDAVTGEAWFLATDVAKALGFLSPYRAIAAHTAETGRKTLKYKASSETEESKLWSKNDFSDKIFINESGLYCMIFGGKLPSVESFKLYF